MRLPRVSWTPLGRLRYAMALATALCLSEITHSGPVCDCGNRLPLLMDLYNSTSGPQWTNNAGWGTASPCSTDWYGVTCSGSDVTQVQLYSNRLVGTLPASWSSMSSLQVLYLYSNSLTGTLPGSWSSMSSLQYLYLYANSLTGTLPGSWSSMSSLQMLFLYANSLTGILPGSWSSMSSLQVLYLYANSLAGTLPGSWSSMSSLHNLQLYTNSLVGTLPASWSSMSSLQYLYLYANSLTGTLPASWSSMSSLHNLRLYANSLTGTLPASWSSMSSLETLELRSNCLYGAVPSAYAALVPHLANNSVSLCYTNLADVSAVLGAKLYTGCGGGKWPVYCSMTESSTPSRTTASPSPAYTPSLSASVTLSSVSWSMSLTFSTSSTSGSKTGSPSHRTTAPNTHFNPSSSASVTLSSVSRSMSLTFSTSSTSGSKTGSPSRRTTAPNTHSTAIPTIYNTVNLGSLTQTPSVPSRSPTFTATLSPLACTVNASGILVGLPPPRNSELWLANQLVATLSATGSFGAVPYAKTALSTILSAPIERSVIAATPDLTFNLTIAAPASATRWSVVHVAMRGQHLNFTAVSPNTAPWHAVVVGPPSREWGWLAPGTPLLADRAIELRVVLSCDGEPVLTVDLTVPAPGIPREFAGRVVAATQYSQLASVLAGGATTGSALGRTMAIRSMVMCDADAAVSGGVLDLDLAICAGGTTGNDASASARSAVLSNLVLVGCVAFILLLLAPLWAHLRGCSIGSAMRELSLPSALLPVCTAVLPSTAASVALLAARLGNSPCSATDSVLVVCGVFLVVLPIGALIAVWRAKTCSARPAWVCVHAGTPHSAPMGTTFLVPLRVAFHRNWKWITVRGPMVHESNDDAQNNRCGPGHECDGEMRSAWVVLLEYRLVWYGALDSAMLAAFAALVVGGGLDASNADLCRACGVLVVVLIAAQLVVLAIARPFTTLFSLVHAAVSLSLTCVSAASQLVFVEVSSTDSSGLWLAQFSAACDLAVVGVSAVRVLFDVSEIAAAVRRRLALLRRAPSAAPAALTVETTDFWSGLLPAGRTAQDDDTDDALLATATCNPGLGQGPAELLVSVEFDEQQEVELEHWDTDGCSMLTGAICMEEPVRPVSAEEGDEQLEVGREHWDADGCAVLPSDDDEAQHELLTIPTAVNHQSRVRRKSRRGRE